MQQGFSVQHSSPAGDFTWLVILCIALGIICLLWAVVCLILWWKVFSKAGYAGALALLTLVPLFGDLILLCILAFSKWPVLREIERLRQPPSQPPQA